MNTVLRAAAVLVMCGSSAVAEDTPFDVLKAAMKAAKANLRSEAASGKFEHFRMSAGDADWKLVQSADVSFSFERPKYHILLSYQLDSLTGTVSREIVYDGRHLSICRYSPRIVHGGVVVEIHQPKSAETVDREFPWNVARLEWPGFDPTRSENSLNCEIERTDEDTIELRIDASDLQMKCLFTKAAGFHPVKLRLTRSDLKEPVYEIDIDWRKENDVWCAVRLETISRPPEERWSRSRMVLDKIAVNPKIEEREFKLDLAPGTRIIDRTGADVEVRYAK